MVDPAGGVRRRSGSRLKARGPRQSHRSGLARSAPPLGGTEHVRPRMVATSTMVVGKR